MYLHQMTLEAVCTIKCLFCNSSRARAEVADDGSFKVRRARVTVTIILSCETFGVKLTACDGTFLWSLILVSEHVGLDIAHHAAAVWIWALMTSIIALYTACS